HYRVDFCVSLSGMTYALHRSSGERVEPQRPVVGTVLGENSTAEYRAGRGMLTAIVVHKSGDRKPGAGFYECAEALGLDTSDIDRLWVDQLNYVNTYGRKQRQQP